MNLRILFTQLLLVTLPCSAYSARFVLMTPETQGQSAFQPWLYHAFKDPETVIVAVPYHKGDKKYWLVRANRTLSDDELNLRTVIHSHNSRPLPDHIESISMLSPYSPGEASGAGEPVGIIYVKIRRDSLKNYYVVHDFPDEVDDGGDFRTYKLAAYAVDPFELGQDRISEYYKELRDKRESHRESLPQKSEVNSLACGAPIDDLASPDQAVRDKAAEVLRAAFQSTPETKWTAVIEAIKDGQTKKEVLELLRPFNVVEEGGEMETGFSPIHARSYRLDHEWILVCYFHDEGEKLTGRKLVKSLKHVWVPPPEDFTGTWVVYWANGQKSHEIDYKDGKYFGRLIAYHEDGSMQTMQHYTEDGADGEDTGYYPSGKVLYRGRYKSGKPVGTWTWYDEAGKIRSNREHPNP